MISEFFKLVLPYVKIYFPKVLVLYDSNTLSKILEMYFTWIGFRGQAKKIMIIVKNYSDKLFIFQKENIVSIPEYTFFKPGQIVRYKRHYARQGEFKTGGTLRICATLKTIWSYCTLINITLT